MLERGRKREREGPRDKRRQSRNARGDAEMEDAASGDEEQDDDDVDGGGSMNVDGDVRSKSKGVIKRQKKERVESARREQSNARSHSRPREPSQMGLKDESMAKVARTVEKKGQRKWFGGSGEGDHTKSVHLVKWCNTGKKRNGTHYSR